MQISSQTARTAGAMPASASRYASLDDMQNSLLAQGRRFTKEYATKFSASSETSGKMAIGDLMAQLQQEFPRYTFTSSKPADVVPGQNLLHIDQANLQKMADDPSYRAEVMGLIKRESLGLDGANVQMGGQSVRVQLTGTVVSISNDNPNVDGIPYSGWATSAGSSITTSSSGGSSSSAKTNRGSTTSPTLSELLKEIAEKRAEERKAEEERQAKAEQQQGQAATTPGRIDILV